MPHIHWRRLCDKIEEIPTYSDARTCTEMHRSFKSLKKLIQTLDSSGKAIKNPKQTNFWKNAVDSPVDSNNNLDISDPNSDFVSS